MESFIKYWKPLLLCACRHGYACIFVHVFTLTTVSICINSTLCQSFGSVTVSWCWYRTLGSIAGFSNYQWCWHFSFNGVTLWSTRYCTAFLMYICIIPLVVIFLPLDSILQGFQELCTPIAKGWANQKSPEYFCSQFGKSCVLSLS